MTTELISAAAEHARALAQRMNVREIAKLAGLSASAVSRITSAPTTVHMQAVTAHKLLSVPLPPLGTARRRMFVDADRARLHLCDLIDTHSRPLTQIAAQSGMARQSLQKIISGRRKRIEETTEATILAVTPGQVPIATSTRVDAREAREHLTRLIDAGAYMSDLAVLGGSTSTTLMSVLRGEHLTMVATTAARVLAITVEGLPKLRQPAVDQPRRRAKRVVLATSPSWGKTRRAAAQLWRDGASVAQIAARLEIPESRVRDALAGVSGPRAGARGWPPAGSPARTGSTRGRAA